MTTTSTLYASFAELCLCSGMGETHVLELIEQEIITPEQGQTPAEWQFAITAINRVKRAERVRRELMVEWEDVPLVLSLLDEIGQLRAENSQLTQRLRRFLAEEND